MTAFVLKYIFILRSLLKINIYLRIHFSDSTHASCLGLIIRLASVTIANCANGQHDDPHPHRCCSPRSDCTDLINSVRIRYNCSMLFWICLSLLLALGFACRCCSPRSDSPRHGSHQQHQACQFPYVSGTSTQYNCTMSSLRFIRINLRHVSCYDSMTSCADKIP
jgi:hypothetical protein